MKLPITYQGKQQTVQIPDSKKTVAQVLQAAKKAFKLEQCELYVDGKALSDKDAITDAMKIEVKVPKAADALKENEEEQYEVEYEDEEDYSAYSSDYNAGDSSYSD